MQIRFADSRPTGDYALVLPVAGKDRSSLGFAGRRSTGRDRRARPPAVRGRGIERVGAVHRRQWHAAPLAGRRDRRSSSAKDAAEKLGGTAVSRLLTSGETKAVIDVSGLGNDADIAARVGLAAALRCLALRPLPDQAQGQAEANPGGNRRRWRRPGRRRSLRQALGAGLRRRVADPRARHRAGQHHLPGKLRRTGHQVARRQRS